MQNSHLMANYGLQQNYGNEYQMGPAKVAPLVSPFCPICGHPELLVRCGGQCCHMCENFFRNIIIKRNKYVCDKDNDCVIIDEDKKKCKACRFRKCLDAGMDPKLVGTRTRKMEEGVNLDKWLNEPYTPPPLPPPPPPCQVCQHPKSSGCNYGGGQSCQACATFFRATTVRGDVYICRQAGSCRITVSSRNRCQACRMDACLRIGMKMENVKKPDSIHVPVGLNENDFEIETPNRWTVESMNKEVERKNQGYPMSSQEHYDHMNEQQYFPIDQLEIQHDSDFDQMPTDLLFQEPDVEQFEQALEEYLSGPIEEEEVENVAPMVSTPTPCPICRHDKPKPHLGCLKCRNFVRRYQALGYKPMCMRANSCRLKVNGLMYCKGCRYAACLEEGIGLVVEEKELVDVAPPKKTTPIEPVVAPDNRCQICPAQSAKTFRFGVQACRGCGDFFRNAVQNDIIYECKWQNRCKMVKTRSCSACRMVACLKAGMDPGMVTKRKRQETVDNEQLDGVDMYIHDTIVNQFDRHIDHSIGEMMDRGMVYLSFLPMLPKVESETMKKWKNVIIEQVFSLRSSLVDDSEPSKNYPMEVIAMLCAIMVANFYWKMLDQNPEVLQTYDTFVQLLHKKYGQYDFQNVLDKILNVVNSCNI